MSGRRLTTAVSLSTELAGERRDASFVERHGLKGEDEVISRQSLRGRDLASAWSM